MFVSNLISSLIRSRTGFSRVARGSLLGLAIFVLPLAAQAVDGVLEINQACAVKTGCFSGDSAGYPVTITRTGSYRLTGNLSREFALGDVNDHRIDITANDVHLDLNGFRIGCSEIVVPSEESSRTPALASGSCWTGQKGDLVDESLAPPSHTLRRGPLIAPGSAEAMGQFVLPHPEMP